MRTRTRYRTAARTAFRAAVDWVRSFTLKDKDLYVDRTMATESGSFVSARTILQLDAAWGCVRLLAETIATLPLSIYERGPNGKKIAQDHPLHYIIHDQPNVDSTAAVFWEAMIAAMLLRGAGRAERLMVGNKLVGLQFLNPDLLVINRDVNTGQKRYIYMTERGQREIPAARIWTVPGFSLDGMNGCSVIAYGAKVFGSAIAAERAAARTFINGMLQTVYYKVTGWVTDKQRRDFHTNVIGTVERGETPLLEGGVEPGTIGLKPEDAQLLQTREYGVEMVCRWFRCDPSLVGHGNKDSNWGTGLEQKMIGFLTFTLAPWLRRIEQAIAKDLLAPSERRTYYAKFAVEGLLRADSAARAAFYGTMVDHGIYTRDFCRELEEQPPMGGNAAVLTVQSAMVPLDKIGEAANDPAAQVRNALVAWLRTAQEDDMQQLQAALKETQGAIATARI